MAAKPKTKTTTRAGLDTVDDTHVFALSQIYEGLLLKMCEQGLGSSGNTGKTRNALILSAPDSRPQQ